MSEITRLEISGFQSHKKTTVEPAPAGQLTVIVGPSDTGKSAVIRALRWLYYNVPQGTDYINVAGKTARVTALFGNGQTVTRERHQSSFNRYLVNDQRYEGFGNTVPAEVEDVTGVRPITVGDIDLNLNLSEQLDGPFLGKAVSAPAKAKVLGKMAGTEEVDYAAKQLGTDLHHRRQDNSRLRVEITSLQLDIKAYDYLEPLGEAIHRVAETLAAVKDNAARKERLEALRDRLAELDKQIVECSRRIDTAGAFIDKGSLLAAVVDASNIKLGRLMTHHIRLQTIDAGLNEAELLIEGTASLAMACLLVSRTAAEVDDLQRLNRLHTSLAGVDAGLEEARKVLVRTEGINRTACLLPAAGDKIYLVSGLKARAEILVDINQGLSRCNTVIDRLADLATAETTVTGAAAAVERVKRLTSVQVRLDVVDQSLAQSNRTLVRLAGLEAAETALTGLAERQNRLTSLHSKQQSLKLCVGTLASTEKDYKQHDTTICRLREEYANALAESGTCPTCGAQVNQFRLKEVV